MCDMVRKWVWVGKKSNSAVAFINPSNWEGCKVKQVFQRIRKFGEFCGLGSFYYFCGVFFFRFALILLRRAKRKELWEMTVEFSKRLEIGRKCGGKKWRLHWICRFEMREEGGRAVRSDREDRQKQERWIMMWKRGYEGMNRRFMGDWNDTAMELKSEIPALGTAGGDKLFNTDFEGCCISI